MVPRVAIKLAWINLKTLLWANGLGGSIWLVKLPVDRLLTLRVGEHDSGLYSDSCHLAYLNSAVFSSLKAGNFHFQNRNSKVFNLFNLSLFLWDWNGTNLFERSTRPNFWVGCLAINQRFLLLIQNKLKIWNGSIRSKSYVERWVITI